MTDLDTRPGSILVPVDFSAHSAAALEFAAELAERLDAPLLVLHVLHDPAAAPGYYSDVDRGGQVALLEDRAQQMLDEFMARMREKRPALDRLHVNAILVIGLPANRILEVADKTQARMIVMGSQGRTGLSHLLLGSKAQRVVQLSPIPVTIVKEPIT